MNNLFLADIAALDSSLRDSMAAYLSPAEFARYAQFKQLQAADTFLLGRYLCRHGMSKVAGLPLAELIMAASGPTRFEQELAPWRINLSHSHALAACLISDTGGCGVDIEYLPRTRPFQRLLSRFFDPSELRHFADLEPAQLAQRFYRSWTLKEAFVKARAKTVAHHLNDLRVSFTNPPIQLKLLGGEMHWRFAQAMIGEYVLSWVSKDAAVTQIWQLDVLNGEFVKLPSAQVDAIEVQT